MRIFLSHASEVTAIAETIELALSTWRHPSGRVLPVIVKPTDLNLVPAYLKAVTLLEPQGNIGAAVGAAVARIRAPMVSIDSRADRRRRDVAVARERLAMEWLGNIRVTAGKDSFTSIADPVEPVLAVCAQSTERERAADCRAHLAWADFLRTREGAGGLSPVRHYEQALELDPDNVFAHTVAR